MPLHDNELARREHGSISVRTTPIRLRWSLDDLVTSDGHCLRASLSCSVRALNTPAERRMLEETFLMDDYAARTDRVVEHFQPPLRAAIAIAVANQPAEAWLANGARISLVDPIQKAANRVAFACGLECIPPFELDLDSPTLEHQRLEAMQRDAAERRISSQIEHAQRAGHFIKQFEDLQRSSPNLSPSALLQQVGPADQASILQLLLQGAGKDHLTKTLWAVAGSSLVRIDLKLLLDSSVPSTQRTSRAITHSPLHPALGPLRSIRVTQLDSRPTLLVGARSGIMVCDPESTNNARLYADPNIPTQLGFSAVVAFDNQFWASHREAGLVAWNCDNTERPAITVRPADLPGRSTSGSSANNSILFTGAISAPASPFAGARNLTRLSDKRLVFSSGNILCSLETGGVIVPMPADHTAEIIALLPVANQLLVVHEDGLVATHDRESLNRISQSRPSGKLCAATLLPWLSSARLLLATNDGPILCTGLDDPITTQYQSPHRGLRTIVSSPDVIAAVSSDRQRLILWRPWETRQPANDVNFLPIARHRVADIALG